jgi:hypothetical protein
MDGVTCDIYLLDGDAMELTNELRAAAAYPDEAEILLDAPFDLIVPFEYGFAERIRNSSLPQTIERS